MGLDTWSGMLAVMLISMVSSFIHGSVGFGFSVFAMTLMPMFLPLRVCAVVIVTALTFTTIVIVARLWRKVNWRLILIPIIVLNTMFQVGLHLLFAVDDRTPKRILGVLLVAMAVFMFFFQHRVKIRPTPANAVLFSAIGGMMGGMYNMAGPPMVVYLLNATDDTLEYSASMNALFVPPCILGVLTHVFYYDSFTRPVIYVSLLSIIGIIIGTWLGVATMKRLNRELLTKIIYAYMAVMGIVMCLAV